MVARSCFPEDLVEHARTLDFCRRSIAEDLIEIISADPLFKEKLTEYFKQEFLDSDSLNVQRFIHDRFFILVNRISRVALDVFKRDIKAITERVIDSESPFRSLDKIPCEEVKKEEDKKT